MIYTGNEQVSVTVQNVTSNIEETKNSPTPESIIGKSRYGKEMEALQQAGYHVNGTVVEEGLLTFEIVPLERPAYRLLLDCSPAYPAAAPAVSVLKISGTPGEADGLPVPFEPEVLEYWNENCTLALIVDEFVAISRKPLIPLPRLNVPVAIWLGGALALALLVTVVALAIILAQPDANTDNTAELTSLAGTASALQTAGGHSDGATATALAFDLQTVLNRQTSAIARATAPVTQQVLPAPTRGRPSIPGVLDYATPTPLGLDTTGGSEPTAPEIAGQPSRKVAGAAAVPGLPSPTPVPERTSSTGVQDNTSVPALTPTVPASDTPIVDTLPAATTAVTTAQTGRATTTSNPAPGRTVTTAAPPAAPTDTAVPTSAPDPTSTSVPDPTNTPVPEPTNTPVPQPTDTPAPTASPTPDPTTTAAPTDTPVPPTTPPTTSLPPTTVPPPPPTTSATTTAPTTNPPKPTKTPRPTRTPKPPR